MTVKIFEYMDSRYTFPFNGILLDFRTGKIQWRVFSTLTNVDIDTTSITLDAECTPLMLYEPADYQSNNWSCDAEIILELSNADRHSYDIKLNNNFNNNSTLCEIVTFTVVGIGQLNYRAKVEINSMFGFDQPISEFSIPRNIDTEIVLRNGIHKLYVDKYALMPCSSVFRQLILTDNNGTEPIEIELIKPYEGYDRVFEIVYVVEFLRLLYRQNLDLNEKDDMFVTDLLKLAKGYDIQFLISDLENFLIGTESKQFDNDNKLFNAEQFQLPRLQLEVMKNMTIEDVEKSIRGMRAVAMTYYVQNAKMLLVHLCNFFDDDDDDYDDCCISLLSLN